MAVMKAKNERQFSSHQDNFSPASCQRAVSTVFLTGSRLRRVRLVVRTQPSQGWYTGSTPVRAARAFLIGKKRQINSQFFDVHDGFMTPVHVYEVRQRKDHCGGDLISDAVSFIWCRS
jgi:hypothetical protein